jgi:hypothetical protein
MGRAGQDRRQDRAPWPLRRVPICGGGGDPSAVRGHPSRDRPPPAKAAPKMSWLLHAPPPRASGCWKTAPAGAAAWRRASLGRCTGMAQGGRGSSSSCPRQRPCSHRQRPFGVRSRLQLSTDATRVSARLAWTPRWRTRQLRAWRNCWRPLGASGRLMSSGAGRLGNRCGLRLLARRAAPA